jgi:hypothetical protein
MFNEKKDDLKKILKLVKEIHSKIFEPSTTTKVASGVKNAIISAPKLLEKIQQRGGKNKTKKNKVKKNKSRKK